MEYQASQKDKQSVKMKSSPLKTSIKKESYTPIAITSEGTETDDYGNTPLMPSK